MISICNFYLDLLSEGGHFQGYRQNLIKLMVDNNSWGKNDTEALQMLYGIIGLINYYQKSHDSEGILQLKGNKWKDVKILFDHWFESMSFQQQIQAKQLLATVKLKINQCELKTALISMINVVRLDPSFWKYRGCNFSYPNDILKFLDIINDQKPENVT